MDRCGKTENSASPFKGSDEMRIIVWSQPHLLPVLSRFGIALGFGESTVTDVCRRDEVDRDTFLAVCNFFSQRDFDASTVDLPTLVRYLKSSHTFFLEYALPAIRSKLLTAMSPGSAGDLAWMMIRFYDEYVGEVRRHMAYEEDVVFPYVMKLSEGVRTPGYSISEFEKNHLPIADKLRDIKELFISHYTANLGRVDMLNSVLFDIINCEGDLLKHCALEDRIFVPLVQKIEGSVEIREKSSEPGTEVDVDTDKPQLDENGDIILTPREIDIVRSIAQGFSNKEIADKLFLSVHTVTTHRRNICGKLNIHSASGLTIYALMHSLITLDECRV